MSQRTLALAWKYPSNQFAVNDETGSIIHWEGPDPEPDETQIQQAETEYAVVSVEVKTEKLASYELNTPLNKTLLDIFLDIETRLRDLSSTSGLPDIAAATNQADYTLALKTILKAKM